MKAKIKKYIPDIIFYIVPILFFVFWHFVFGTVFGVFLLPLYLSIISIWRASRHKLKNPIIMLVPSMAVLIISFAIIMDFSIISFWEISLPVWVNLLVHFFTYGYMTIFIVAYHIEVKIQNRKKNKEKE